MKKCFVFMFTFVIGGCVVNDPTMVIVRKGRFFNHEKIQDVRAGSTSVHDAIRILGEPYQHANINGRKALVYRNQVIVKKAEKTNVLPGDSEVPTEPTETIITGLTVTQDVEYHLFIEDNLIQSIEKVR